MVEDEEKPNTESYYDLDEAWREVKSDFSSGSSQDKVAATTKLLGKVLFNTGLYAGRLGIAIIKNLPEIIEKGQIRREEIRERFEDKDDHELQRIVKSSLSATTKEQDIAKSILRERNS
ncbi:hypothetical protein HX776_05600 [Pseudomonas agarici]|uniref:hypothetical protein n=1 Tax=Pseudomonas agarici TaxID=46677 RepID=UPI00037407A7|nr:hypothetical protein [Pseudomonas agarici]NWC08301.1 hypothetical protein [Pseudomonas agarici]